MINEKQIQYLLTVAKEQNITAAARKLYISQPALSRMILDLEDSLGTQLFVRDRGNLHLTQAGEVYLRGCREVLAVSKAVSNEISDLKNSRNGKIKLGITSFTGEFTLPHILDRFKQEFPHVELILVEDRMSALQDMVKSGKADMALVYQTEDEELEYHLLWENPVYIQVPPFFSSGRADWKPGTENPDISPGSLSGQPMILLKKGRGMREMAERLKVQSGISFGKVIETENIHLASTLVYLDRGFTFIPGIATRRLFYRDTAGFYCQVKDHHMKRSLYCCYQKRVYLTKAERFLIEIMQAQFHQMKVDPILGKTHSDIDRMVKKLLAGDRIGTALSLHQLF